MLFLVSWFYILWFALHWLSFQSEQFPNKKVTNEKKKTDDIYLENKTRLEVSNFHVLFQHSQ